jgi:hypothetical protein
MAIIRYLINYLLAGGPAPVVVTGVSATIVGIQGSLSFSPDPFNANAGQTIAWTNSDFATDRIVADDASFATGNIPSGEQQRRNSGARGGKPPLPLLDSPLDGRDTRGQVIF